MEAAGSRVSTRPTTGPNTAEAIAREAIEGGVDLIAVAGGDGTVNEVVNGVVHSSVPVGVLPGGTANVLGHELGIPLRMDRAARELASWKPRKVALGRIEFRDTGRARYFLLMAGAGLDAEIVSRLNLRLKDATGKFAYWAAGFARVFRPVPQFSVRAEGRQETAGFALFSRVRNYGGDLEIARTVTLADDCFEMVLFRGAFPLRYLRYLLAVVLGTPARTGGVTVLPARRVELAGARIYAQVDGELAGVLPATIEIVPEALTLLLPPDYIAKAQQSAWTTSRTLLPA